MTDIQQLKDAAFAQYQKQGRYHIIYTNYITDMFKEYDTLVAQGYKRAPDSYTNAANMNLSVLQVVHMEKPVDVQQAELQAIYDKIEEANK
ncbi:hypothetical protein [Pseudomonas guariconensis]|uniref:hypothetical protein n=1 Tax=Pseudomonas guariconensis TaxID=1288410 RepID=UPI0018AC62DC|nr:hypothetical protein [Pseudomonas guariconensis]MBF8740227.1 hypothetical protein [Pseudomonas guariconensis]MBF8750370.1 hypothetical protein [Pseudomonas guariconensis]